MRGYKPSRGQLEQVALQTLRINAMPSIKIITLKTITSQDHKHREALAPQVLHILWQSKPKF